MMDRWAAIGTVARRELAAYFESPVAYVFLAIFLLLAGFFTFAFGGFFERGEASLPALFHWLPWLFPFLVPPAGGGPRAPRRARRASAPLPPQARAVSQADPRDVC